MMSEKKKPMLGHNGEFVNVLKIKMSYAKLYIPSTLNIDLILWHTQLIVCAVKC
jgi:hypothetical protein